LYCIESKTKKAVKIVNKAKKSCVKAAAPSIEQKALTLLLS
jgi:hypothetical protein